MFASASSIGSLCVTSVSLLVVFVRFASKTGLLGTVNYLLNEFSLTATAIRKVVLCKARLHA
eukprot:781094-Amphidinium_carterae.1